MTLNLSESDFHEGYIMSSRPTRLTLEMLRRFKEKDNKRPSDSEKNIFDHHDSQRQEEVN